MFYRPQDGHGLPHNPFNAIITPRPIGWISTRSPDGINNLSPYSFFNGVAYTPPQVMFASTGTKPDQSFGKDSVTNIQETGEFCVNVVAAAMTDQMNITSETMPAGSDEFDAAGLAKIPCEIIGCSRVAGSPAALECRMSHIVTLQGEHNYLIVGEVVGIHIDDTHLRDGILDITSYQPLSRLGYRDYTIVKDSFTLKRPDDR